MANRLPGRVGISAGRCPDAASISGSLHRARAPGTREAQRKRGVVMYHPFFTKREAVWKLGDTSVLTLLK